MFHGGRCYFAKAKCGNTDLTILYPGPCVPQTTGAGDVATTAPALPPANNLTDTDSIIQEQFCLYRDQIMCPDTLDPVCGTDAHFYQNE